MITVIFRTQNKQSEHETPAVQVIWRRAHFVSLDLFCDVIR